MASSSYSSHKLAGGVPSDLEVDVRARVVAAVDLPGVPAGTEGRVTLKNGFQWSRYRVRFRNGVELGNLDGRHLGLPQRKAKRGLWGWLMDDGSQASQG
jgi:hypothetical protein